MTFDIAYHVGGLRTYRWPRDHQISRTLRLTFFPYPWSRARESSAKMPPQEISIFIFFCTIQYTTRTEMVNPCHQPCGHSKVWYGRTTLSGESGWISCSPNRYWSIAFRNFTSLSPTFIAWRLKTPSFDRFSATFRTNRLKMVARTTETETTLKTEWFQCQYATQNVN